MAYKVKFDTGETVTFQNQPTDADIEEVVTKLGIKPKSATIPDQQNIRSKNDLPVTSSSSTNGLNQFGTSLKDEAVGAGKSAIKGAVGLASGLQKLGQKVLGVNTQQGYGFKSLDPSTKEGASVQDTLAPKSQAEQFGGALETAGELAYGGQALLQGVAKGASKLKNVLFKPKDALQEAIDITRPVLNKKEAISTFEKAGQPGGITTKGALKNAVVQPDKRSIEIADSVKDIVSKKSGPIDNIVNINKEISRVAEQEVKPFLNQNKTPFNFDDLRTYMEQRTKPTSSLKADPEAFKTYGRVRESILNTIYKELKTSASKSKDFGSATDFNNVWDARKVIDDIAEKELGATTFDSPQYTGVRAAVKDARENFSSFITDSFSNPGHMSKVNRMYEFLQESAKRGGVDLSTEEDALKLIEKKFGITRTTVDEARAAFFKDRMNKLNRMYDARGNIAESNYKLLDKNALQRWIKQNPAKWKVIKNTGLYLGLPAIGYELIK